MPVQPQASSKTISFEFNKDKLDLPLTVQCGQVFLWERDESGVFKGSDGGTRWEVHGNSVVSNYALDRFESYFRLHGAWAEAERQMSANEPGLSPFMERYMGLRLVAPNDPIASLFSFLCSSNNHLSRIRKMVRYLASLGPPFPSIDRLSDTTEAELRAAGFGYRGKTIPEVAKRVCADGGLPWLSHLSKGPYEEAKRYLCSLAGIGPKLADCICLYALGHTEAVPVDTHLWQAVCRLYWPHLAGENLTVARYEAIGEKFRDRHGKLAGWAHLYLFVDNQQNWRTYRGQVSSGT